MKYIIEFKLTNGGWLRSSNGLKTVKDAAGHHGTYEFDSLKSAKKEIAAQTDGLEYRAVLVEVEEAIATSIAAPIGIDPLFKGHTLSAVGQNKAVEIAELFTQLIVGLDSICPKGREFSIVRTKLEEASFYAKKSLISSKGNLEQ